MIMRRTDWSGLMAEGRRRFVAFATVGELPPEPTPAEAARITVARGRVQAEHDQVLAEVDRLVGQCLYVDADDTDRLAAALDTIDRLMPDVDGGVAYDLYRQLAVVRDALGLPGLTRYPGGS